MTVLQTSMAKVENQKGHQKPKSEGLKIHFVATDLNFARALAGNNKAERDRALNRLKEYFIKRSKVSPFTTEDFLRLWKGLFYAMWISDKPLNQEECAENISHLIHNFDSLESCLLFFKGGLITLQNEWLGIDQLRLDKFLMFVRRFLRQGLFALKRFKFNQNNIIDFSKVVEETVLNTTKTPNLGLAMHFTEIFLEELAKVSDGTLSPNLVVLFVKPFIKKMAYAKDQREIKCIRKFIFAYLIKQHNLGLEYREKYEAWRALGFPGSIDSIQKVVIKHEESESDNETIIKKEKVLDPRAGKVNVDLPQIKFHPKSIAEALLLYKSDKDTTSHSRKTITDLAQNFETLAKGVYPYGQKRILPKDSDNERINIRKAAKDLIKLDNKLLGKTKKKNRKRKIYLEEENNYSDGLTPSKKIKTAEITQTTKSKKTKGKKEQSVKEKVEEKKLLKGKKRKIEETIITNCLEENVAKKRVKTKLDNTTNILKNGDIKVQHTGKKTLKKKCKIQNGNNKYEDDVVMVFERNSGTWVVTKSETEQIANTPIKFSVKVEKQDTSPIIKPDKDSQNSNVAKDFLITATKLNNLETSAKPFQKNHSHVDKVIKISSTHNGILHESPKVSPKHDLPRFASLQDFLRHENQVRRLKNQGLLREINQKYNEAETANEKHRANGDKTKNNLTSPLQNGTSPKKVRINMKLNTSQDLDEHIVQVMASPQIPFDSSKVPGKPLLKTPIKSSPINPFFKLRKSSIF